MTRYPEGEEACCGTVSFSSPLVAALQPEARQCIVKDYGLRLAGGDLNALNGKGIYALIGYKIRAHKQISIKIYCKAGIG
jgi:hypothetical protein